MNEQPKLKPCPFCGGEAYYTRVRNSWDWECHCFVCDATVRVDGWMHGSSEERLRKGRKDVITQWNQRILHVGHWVAIRQGEEDCAFKCSECGDVEFLNTPYCPRCGAFMGEKTDD